MNPDVVTEIEYEEGMVFLRLGDGCEIGNPLEWHLWLEHASAAQRATIEFYELCVYFPDLDDGLDVAEMMKGAPPRFNRQVASSIS